MTPPPGWRSPVCCTISASSPSAPTCHCRIERFSKSTSRSTAPIRSRIRTVRAGSRTCTRPTPPSLSMPSSPIFRRSRDERRVPSRSGGKHARVAPTIHSSMRPRSTTSRTPSYSGSWQPPIAPHRVSIASNSTSTTRHGTRARRPARRTTRRASTPYSSRSISRMSRWRTTNERSRAGTTDIVSLRSLLATSSPYAPTATKRTIEPPPATSTRLCGRNSGQHSNRSPSPTGRTCRYGSTTSIRSG